MGKRYHGGSGNDISGFAWHCPQGCSRLFPWWEAQQPCKWELCKAVGRGRGLEHPGGRLQKGSRERESNPASWKDIFEGHGYEIAQGCVVLELLLVGNGKYRNYGEHHGKPGFVPSGEGREECSSWEKTRKNSFCHLAEQPAVLTVLTWAQRWCWLLGAVLPHLQAVSTCVQSSGTCLLPKELSLCKLVHNLWALTSFCWPFLGKHFWVAVAEFALIFSQISLAGVEIAGLFNCVFEKYI